MKKVKSNKVKPRLQSRRVVARWAAFFSIVSGIAGYSLSLNAYSNPASHSYTAINFAVQNVGIILIILQAFFAWILKRAQYGIYWFWWLQLQNVKPDERQSAVRQRVFVRAYGFTILLLALFLQQFVSTLLQYNDPARGDLLSRAMWVMAIFSISLPSILAAWEKDS